jgi:alpha-tubulin suppressor-like RCC1 family protein
MKKENSRRTSRWLAAAGLILLLSLAGCSNDRLLSAGSTETPGDPDGQGLDAAKIYWTAVFPSKGWFAFALQANGNLWAVGDNSSGQLGTGDTNDRSTFVPVLTNVAYVSAGGNFTLAVKKDKTLWVAGSNADGQIGLGDYVKSTTTFVKVMDRVGDVAAGKYHSLAIQGFTVMATGLNSDGQLGTGDTNNRTTFVPVMEDGFRIAAGSYHSLVIWSPDWSHGYLYTTGWNNHGQLGTNDTNNRKNFTRVLDNVYRASGGGTHSVAVTTDNAVWTTGSNYSGQLCLGNYDDKHVFTQAVPPSSALISQVSAGASTTFLKKNNALLQVAGRNVDGELGLNSDQSSFPSLTSVAGTFYVRSNGAGQLCGFYVNGANYNLYATGWNTAGQLGTGDGRNYRYFTQTGK